MTFTLLSVQTQYPVLTERAILLNTNTFYLTLKLVADIVAFNKKYFLDV